MEERTTVEKRTTIVPDPAAPVGNPGGTTNVNIDTDTGATTVQTNEPATRETVRETTVEKRTTT